MKADHTSPEETKEAKHDANFISKDQIDPNQIYS